jgi:hypothetical protein
VLSTSFIMMKWCDLLPRLCALNLEVVLSYCTRVAVKHQIIGGIAEVCSAVGLQASLPPRPGIRSLVHTVLPLLFRPEAAASAFASPLPSSEPHNESCSIVRIVRVSSVANETKS